MHLICPYTASSDEYLEELFLRYPLSTFRNTFANATVTEKITHYPMADSTRDLEFKIPIPDGCVEEDELPILIESIIYYNQHKLLRAVLDRVLISNGLHVFPNMFNIGNYVYGRTDYWGTVTLNFQFNIYPPKTPGDIRYCLESKILA